MAQAYGIVWTDDLFSPSDQDARTTTQVEEFLAAQNEWLAANLPEHGELAELDHYGDPKLPSKAMRTYGKPRKGDHVACYVNNRAGEVDQVAYCLPKPRRNASTGSVDTEKPAPKARPDITAKGMAMIGDLRTDALHQALREPPIGDDVLMSLLVLGLGGHNVQVHSGAASKGYGWRERIAETLTEGGVLTQDLAVLRTAAREMLVEVLSCRVNMSQSGMGARHAGAAIGADLYLPNMATPEFLSCLSKQAMQSTASANGVAPRNTGKETRTALIAHVGTGSFVHPDALFPPTAKELEARRHPASLVTSEGDEPEDVVSGRDENNVRDVGDNDAEDQTALSPSVTSPARTRCCPPASTCPGTRLSPDGPLLGAMPGGVSSSHLVALRPISGEKTTTSSARSFAMIVALRQPMTLDEFLAWEDQQELRYEFDGVGPVAMAGGTAEHDRISLNLAASLVVRLRGKRCRPCGSNLKVEVMGRVRYPDGYITCSPLVPGATITNDPVVIFEVLSKGTARVDRVEKNREYRTIASVTHSVMLEQDEIAATVLERSGENWISRLLGASDTLLLPSVGIEIPLAELYEELDLSTPVLMTTADA